MNKLLGVCKRIKKGIRLLKSSKRKIFNFAGEIDVLFTLYCVYVLCDPKEYFL